MRKKALFFFFLFVSPLIFSSDSHVRPPLIDLRFPVYLITERSFFLDCDKESALICVNDPACALAACRKRRIDEVKNGIDDWFKHFAEPTRPRAFIVASRDEIPLGAKNPPIYLRVRSNDCNNRDGTKNSACYFKKDGSEPAAIVFDEPCHIGAQLSAHEFGHALGRDDNDVPTCIGSVMSYTISTDVLPVDMEKMCALHPECPPREENW